jgi:hypothetical protein
MGVAWWWCNCAVMLFGHQMTMIASLSLLRGVDVNDQAGGGGSSSITGYCNTTYMRMKRVHEQAQMCFSASKGQLTDCSSESLFSHSFASPGKRPKCVRPG